MLRIGTIILFFLYRFAFSQPADFPFQVLVAENAKVFEQNLAPLTFVDDVTSLKIADGGFVALVHKGGTTYELTEQIFTFYLKPEKLKNRAQRPPLSMLYSGDSASIDYGNTITMLHPKFDTSRLLQWQKNSPITIYWHPPAKKESITAYKITIFDHTGRKIQDYATKHHKFELKPHHYGLQEASFIFQVTGNTFLGEDTIISKKYQIMLKDAPSYPIKASDLVIKALDIEPLPLLALEVWREIQDMENGGHYSHLFEKFIQRNKSTLISAGEDIERLPSQNK